MARIAVSGSIATDHLMTFPGEFAEHLLTDRLDTVSLSFLVEDLVVRRGGVAANIAFGMGQLGLRPVLVGAVGVDFGEYRDWLERHGVDCSAVLVTETAHTARFVCTTDRNLCQIASFYPGAMAESGRISLADIERPGLVLVGADAPDTMLARAAECRRLGLPFAADPSQQLARMSGAEILAFIEGARFLFTNEYESGLLESKTGYGEAELLERVDVRVTTLGARGVRISGRAIAPIEVPAALTTEVRDPTGVGDGFRAGFLTGITWGFPLDRAAELGCLVAAHVIETVGTQEYLLDESVLLWRCTESYGPAAAEALRRRGGVDTLPRPHRPPAHAE